MAPPAFLPPPPAFLPPPAPPGGLIVETTKENVLDIPYLGPWPVTSRPIGRLLQVGCVATGVVALARAGAYWRVAAALQDLSVRRSGAVSTTNVRAALDLVSTIQGVVTATVLATLGLSIAWSVARRPKARRNAQGEAYVESPLSKVVPLWLRLVTSVAWVAGFAGIFARPTTPTGPDALAGQYLWLMASSASWALGWLLYLLHIDRANRALDERMARSEAARARPDVVPYHTPISERAAGDLGTPSGFGWFARMFAMIMAVLVSIVAALALWASLFDPKAKNAVAALVSLGVLTLGVAGFSALFRVHRRARSRG